jgi:hypothetical protein
MKKVLIIPLILASLAFNCKKDNKALFQYQSSVLGGCYQNIKSLSSYNVDTVKFSIVHSDTLYMSYEMQYSCCGKLTNAITTNGSHIKIAITDTSKVGCLCKCLCNYNLDAKFTGLQTGTYTYEILLKDCVSKDFSTFKKGSVYLVKN